MEGQRGRTGSGIHRSLAGALATAQLRRLQAGWAVSAVGGWVFFVALSVYAFDAGGATAVGAAALTRMVPAGLAAPLAGVLADRYSRRDVLFGAIVARALILVGIGAAVAASAPVALVLALGALFTIVATAHRPAQAALLPSLVETPHQLAASNAVWSAIDNGAFLVGALLSGALIATTSMADAFFVTAGLFAVAAWPIARIERDPVPEYRAGAEHARPIADAVHGFREVARDSRLRLVVGVLAISTMVEGAIDVLVVLVAIEMLGLGGSGVGWLNACWGLGGVIGGAAALALLRRGRLDGRAVHGRPAGRDPADAHRRGGNVGRGRGDAGAAGHRVCADRGGRPVAVATAARQRRARQGICRSRELLLDHHRSRGDRRAADRRPRRPARRAAAGGSVPAAAGGVAVAAAGTARSRQRSFPSDRSRRCVPWRCSRRCRSPRSRTCRAGSTRSRFTRARP